MITLEEMITTAKVQPLRDAIAKARGCSKKEADRLIKAGAIKIGNTTINTEAVKVFLAKTPDGQLFAVEQFKTHVNIITPII